MVYEDIGMQKYVLNTMDDPLATARESTANMLQERERDFSLPQPFYNDARLFAIDMQEVFEKEWHLLNGDGKAVRNRRGA